MNPRKILTLFYISALDPAGPAFYTLVLPPPLANLGPIYILYPSLNNTNAGFVQVFHTNAGLYGTINVIGHVDFYINGGSFQPYCELISTSSCTAAPYGDGQSTSKY